MLLIIIILYLSNWRAVKDDDVILKPDVALDTNLMKASPKCLLTKVSCTGEKLCNVFKL